MVPPPPEPTDEKPMNLTSIKDPPYPRVRGQRRNHAEVAKEHAHYFAIGAIVMVKSRSMRRPMGPYKVLEHNQPMYHGGPPQYILAPDVQNPVPADWIQVNERALFDYDPAQVGVLDPNDDDEDSEHEEDDEINGDY